MAEPARKFDNLSTPPGAFENNRRERDQAERLQEQKQRSRNEFAATQLPAQLGNSSRKNQETSTNGTSDEQQAEIINSLRQRYQSEDTGDQKGSKKRTGLDTLRKAQTDLGQLLNGGRQIGLFGYIMFTIMGGISLFLDVLPIITGDLASLIDWIFDIGFYFMLFITMVVMTGELMRSMFGFRGITNLAQTVLEFIPVNDLMPWHTIAIIVLYLDVKYDIVKIVKNLKKGGSPAEGSEAS